MKADAECLPCIVRQVLGVARRVTDDPWLHRRVLAEAMSALAETDADRTPPEIIHDVLRIARRTLGVADPFEEDKLRLNHEALALEEGLRRRVAAAADPLREALALAAAANGIDAVPLVGTVSPSALLAAPLALAIDDTAVVAEDLRKARSVLYVLDNAGELVVDRLVLERLADRADRKVTCVVRKGPGMLDATMFDVEGIGLADRWKVLHTGTDVPGAPLNLCSHDFRDRFKGADVVVAKGQANYETLGEGDRVCAFVMLVKCGVVAQALGVNVGDRVVLRRE